MTKCEAKDFIVRRGRAIVFEKISKHRRAGLRRAGQCDGDAASCFLRRFCLSLSCLLALSLTLAHSHIHTLTQSCCCHTWCAVVGSPWLGGWLGWPSSLLGFGGLGLSLNPESKSRCLPARLPGSPHPPIPYDAPSFFSSTGHSPPESRFRSTGDPRKSQGRHWARDALMLVQAEGVLALHCAAFASTHHRRRPPRTGGRAARQDTAVCRLGLAVEPTRLSPPTPPSVRASVETAHAKG